MTGELMTIPMDKIDRIEHAVISVEKAVVELATIQKEAAKREERITIEHQKSEARILERFKEERERYEEKFHYLESRVDSIESAHDQTKKEVRNNSNMTMKVLGGLSVAVFAAGVVLKII